MSRSKKKKTLAAKIGVSSARLSAKIEKVREEDPTLTAGQAAGKAAGILRGKKHKRS